MKKTMIGLGCLLIALPSLAGAGGTVDVVSFYSAAMNEDRLFQIYLPDGYDSDTGRRYPVVYFLHGALGSHEQYPFIPWIMDELITSNAIEPVIVVKPNGNSGPYFGLSWYTNSPLNGNIEDFVVYDLVNYIDANYRTVPSRHHRAISGHSMGGYGSMRLGLKYPDRFGAIAALAGHHDWTSVMSEWRPQILEEAGSEPPYEYVPFAGQFTFGMFSLAAGFSPDVETPPYYVDLPLDSDGDLIGEVMSQWMPHDCRYLASVLQRDVSIYFDCGTQDHVLIYPANVSFAEKLDDLGLNYEFYSFEGGHDDYMEDRVRRVMTWLNDVRNAEDEDDMDDDDDAHASRSTSSRLSDRSLSVDLTASGTQIRYAVPEASHVRLLIYNASGQLVRSLVDEEMPPGVHTVLWNGHDESGRFVSSGVYFSQLQLDGGHIGSGKIILVR